ncbi:calcium/calmodulin-dependent protein kinase type IV-like [Lycorma delicatula]|uniref:calcium/calmodulin-dependent protein kinase type IV-like n=1 Tax=Lycorma delicatula TaxID=130591 RepID=UPI003F518227
MAKEEEWRWLQQKKTLEDSYILGDIIARGDFSVIHKCLYKGKSERACKIYKKVHLDSEVVPSQINKLLTLSHPNMVQVRDVFENDCEIQLVCDLVNGGELFERIVECGNYNEFEAAKPMKEILSALHYLHMENITHGEVRPENLLYDSVNSSARLKLSNIPLKKKQHSPKLCYSAPEIFELKKFSPASDMWSLGIVLYILLCGIEPLFDGGPFQIQFTDTWWDDISPSAKSLISQCVVCDPEQRITATAALNHPWICGKTTNTYPLPSTQDRLRQFNARRKFKAATQAILATHKAMNLISPQKKTATSR